MSAVVAGELLYGFQRGSRVRESVRELEAFVEGSLVTVLPVTWTTADRFGRIASSLRRKGTPIQTNTNDI